LVDKGIKTIWAKLNANVSTNETDVKPNKPIGNVRVVPIPKR
jgi:hypothetical protein